MPLQEQMTELQNTLDKQISAAVLEHQKAVMPVYEARNNVVDKVPGFWLKALQGHPMLSQVLSEADVEILQSLKRMDMQMDDLDAKVEGGESNRIKLTFTFEKNEFFSNKTVSKTVVSHNGPGEEEEGEYEVESDKIEWKKGKGPAKNSNAKETKKGKKRPAEEEDEEQTDSIFDIFDAEKYGDDTLIEPLRELYMDAEGFYMADPSQFDMGGGCEDEDCDHTHH